jgi:hypothetical protein
MFMGTAAMRLIGISKAATARKAQGILPLKNILREGVMESLTTDGNCLFLTADERRWTRIYFLF